MENHKEIAGFIDRETLAGRLGVCIRTVANLQQRRAIPYYRIGRSVRYRFEEVVATLEENNRVETISALSPKGKSGPPKEKAQV